MAFVADWDGYAEVYVIHADGTGLVGITDNTTVDTAPKWSPDGQRLAFIHDPGRRPTLMVFNPADSSSSFVPADVDIFFDLVWSPTGQHVVLLSGYDLFAVDVLTGEALSLTGEAGFELELPNLSPEGDRLVVAGYSIELGPPENRLFVVNLDGSGMTELRFRAGDARWPSWHPLKDEILFEGEVEGEGVGLYVATLDGSISKLDASPNEAGSLPAWSPDGTMIAYIVGEPDRGVTGESRDSLHVATASEDIVEAVLTAGVGGQSDLRVYRHYWAPGSRHIAYTVTNPTRGPAVDIFVLDICKRTSVLVAEAVKAYPDLSWRPVAEH